MELHNKYPLRSVLIECLSKQEELVRTARELKVLKLSRAALDTRVAGHEDTQTAHGTRTGSSDDAMVSFCRNITMEAVRIALKRLDNRPEVASVRKCVNLHSTYFDLRSTFCPQTTPTAYCVVRNLQPWLQLSHEHSCMGAGSSDCGRSASKRCNTAVPST